MNNYIFIFTLLNNKKLCDINLSEYFSFTTIRNPWARVVSAFNYQKRDKHGIEIFNCNYDETTSKYTFNEFIKYIHDKDYWCGTGNPNANYFCFNENNQQIITKIYPIETLTNDIIKNDIYEHNGINIDISDIKHLHP